MMLEGNSLKRDFMKFIIPSIVAQWVFALYTMVDGIFVARGVSEVALTRCKYRDALYYGAVCCFYFICGRNIHGCSD